MKCWSTSAASLTRLFVVNDTVFLVDPAEGSISDVDRARDGNGGGGGLRAAESFMVCSQSGERNSCGDVGSILSQPVK